tara:strand:- start:12160 stop:13275 length:1116 start_codon:yes stop_codon:yes gene_type:complete
MAVSVGGLVNSADFTSLLIATNAILGNGEGQTGYGQICSSIENYSTVNTTNNISIVEWNAIRTDINKCSRHQSDNDAITANAVASSIIGADASGPNVTRISGDTFSIDTPVATRGVNDWVSAVSTITTNSNLVSSVHYSLTDTRAFLNSSRSTSWGGAGQLQQIYTEFSVTFDGGYTTTNTSGVSAVATSNDHFRHFFNSGGEIRISGSHSGSTSKASDWGLLLGNMGAIVFGKNATTCTGTGRPRDGNTNVDQVGGIESALGAFQLTTGYQLIFQRNGGGENSNYAENYINIYAKRDSSTRTITFQVELVDADVGDQRPREPGAGDPAGPGIDEPVTGTTIIGVDLKRATGVYVSIPAPAPNIVTELRLT